MNIKLVENNCEDESQYKSQIMNFTFIYKDDEFEKIKKFGNSINLENNLHV